MLLPLKLQNLWWRESSRTYDPGVVDSARSWEQWTVTASVVAAAVAVAAAGADVVFAAAVAAVSAAVVAVFFSLA